MSALLTEIKIQMMSTEDIEFILYVTLKLLGVEIMKDPMLQNIQILQVEYKILYEILIEGNIDEMHRKALETYVELAIQIRLQLGFFYNPTLAGMMLKDMLINDIKNSTVILRLVWER